MHYHVKPMEAEVGEGGPALLCAGGAGALVRGALWGCPAPERASAAEYRADGIEMMLNGAINRRGRGNLQQRGRLAVLQKAGGSGVAGGILG